MEQWMSPKWFWWTNCRVRSITTFLIIWQCVDLYKCLQFLFLTLWLQIFPTTRCLQKWRKGSLLLLNFQLKMSSFITKQSFYGVPILSTFLRLCIHQSKLDDKSPHQVAFFHTTSNLGSLADDGHPVIDSGNKASKLQRFHRGYPYNRLIIEYFESCLKIVTIYIQRLHFTSL